MAATETFRAAARWLVAVSGAIAAVLVAGLQLTALGSLAGRRLSMAVVLFLVAITSVGFILLRAAQVLAPTAQTLTELRDMDIAEVRGQAEGVPPLWRSPRRIAKRVLYGSEFKLSAAVNDWRHALESFNLQGVDEIYLLYTGKTPVRIAQQIRAGKPRISRPELEFAAQQLISFVELRDTQHRYKRLTNSLVPAGFLASMSIVFFALTAFPSPDPKVNKPLTVEVIFTSRAEDLKGSLKKCERQVRRGTAVAGTLREPEVYIRPVSAADKCSGRHVINPSIGVVIYK
ncbi:hypothetical protein [Streptomyces cahuitamycinicus]|uniref:hypothetical protein n=1 Tax=Streptomyces cahuitamycinicus TaxID=2070367 RepID=UPI0011AF6D89|nr:hypothetical protein [Streptomyces cahuitamycinicus]